MAKQKVLRLTKRDSPQDLQAFEEDVPTPQAHEALIKIRSVSLNFRDFAISTSKYPFPVKEHVVPGSDLCGEVVQIGTELTELAKGDIVISPFDVNTLYGALHSWHYGLGGPIDGALREYITLPANILIKIPPENKLSTAQLASLVCTGVTAWNALYGNIPLRPGQTVLFQGTGGVSVTGLIFAKAAGAKTFITSSSDDKLAYVQNTYGVDYTINYKTHPQWSQEVLRITSGLGVDYILETGGAGTIAESINAIAYGGNISVIGFLASCPQEKMPDVAALALSKGAVVRGIMTGTKQQLEEVTRLAVGKNLPIPVEKEFKFSRDAVVEALEYMASGQHIGKIVISLQD